MDGFGVYHAKWNKSDRERQILYYLTYMRNLENKTNEQTKQNENRLMDTENKISGWQRGGGLGGDGVGIWG